MSFDEGVSNLEALIAEESARLHTVNNEAETRFHLVDEVLTKVLGWPKSDIHVEQPVDAVGFTDYELFHGPGVVAIVEAKKDEPGFVFPCGDKSKVASIQPLIRGKDSKALRDALNQVASYAAVRGVAPALVTDGVQWIAFLATRNDGIAPLEGKALIFPTLESILDDFTLFWNNLSPDGISSKRLFATLSLETAVPPQKLSAQIYDYPGTRQRNEQQTTLQSLGEIFIDDLPNRSENRQLFLSDCYANSGALSNYAAVSRELLENRYLLLSESTGVSIEPASTRKGINSQLGSDASTAAVSNRPVVLLGSVGVGKSTFIQHLIDVDAKEVFGNSITFLINFGTTGVLSELQSFTVQEIERQLVEYFDIDIASAEFLEDVYRRELERFDKSPIGLLKETLPVEYQLKRVEFLAEKYADKSTHLARSLERISTSHRKQVVIFLDNVDQRSIEDQNRVFLIANELAAQWPATVFVTLRPETYHQSVAFGAASGYHPRVFSIAPPRVDVMLTKRVEFGLKLLENPSSSGSSIGYQSESLELFLKMLLMNLRVNRELLRMIENVAGGNMRSALRFVTQFIGSGHLDTSKIIEIVRTRGEYFIPPHEFLRSLIYGDNKYYDPNSSPIANLFQVFDVDRKQHFLIGELITFLISDSSSSKRRSSTSAKSAFSHLQACGYSLESISAAAEYCEEHLLIERSVTHSAGAIDNHWRPTSQGAYLVNDLSLTFAYVDPMIIDTPILDPDVRAAVRDVFKLEDRVQQTSYFIDYLDSCWDSTLDSMAWSWPKVSKQLRADVERVSARAESALRKNTSV